MSSVVVQTLYMYNASSYPFLCTVHWSETGRGLGRSGYLGMPMNHVPLEAPESD